MGKRNSLDSGADCRASYQRCGCSLARCCELGKPTHSHKRQCHVSSSCTGHFLEGSTAGCCCTVAQTGDHSDSEELPPAGCLWSLNQSPAAPESGCAAPSCDQTTHVCWTSPSLMRPSCWSSDLPSPELPFHFYELFLRSCSRFPESVSSPYPPPTGG